MPDILIRMEMPKTCADCHDADLPTAIAWLGAKCPWVHGIIDPGVYDLRHDRHSDCPLHFLPPHEDLIDRGALFNQVKRRGMVPLWIDTMDVMQMPIIVPASKESKEAER